MNSNTNKKFKGEPFDTRYRIKATLTTVSPLHIGSGEELTEPIPEIERKQGGKDVRHTTKIITDYDDKPIIPGSAIKGAMRHWLENILRSVNPVSSLISSQYEIEKLKNDYSDLKKEEWKKLIEEKCNADAEFSKNYDALTESFKQNGKFKDEFKDEYKRKQKEYKLLLSHMIRPFQLLFGSIHSEAKLEFWDAICSTPEMDTTPKFLNWNSERLVYRQMSVAINPETGTAAEGQLYNFEVVPVGVKFDLTICGQNLDPAELGLLLFALEGFNSEIYPLTLGAMGARGFGRFKLDKPKIHCLTKGDLDKWIEKLLTSDDAGYSSIKDGMAELDAEILLKTAKAEIIKVVNGGGA